MGDHGTGCCWWLEAAVVTWSHDWPGPASHHQPPHSPWQHQQSRSRRFGGLLVSWSRTLDQNVVTRVARAGYCQCVAAGGDGGWTVARLPRWQSGGHELWRPGPGCLMTHGASGSSGHSRGSVATAPVLQSSSVPVLISGDVTPSVFRPQPDPAAQPWSPGSARGDVLRSAPHRSPEPCCSHHSWGYPLAIL